MKPGSFRTNETARKRNRSTIAAGVSGHEFSGETSSSRETHQRHVAPSDTSADGAFDHDCQQAQCGRQPGFVPLGWREKGIWIPTVSSGLVRDRRVPGRSSSRPRLKISSAGAPRPWTVRPHLWPHRESTAHHPGLIAMWIMHSVFPSRVCASGYEAAPVRFEVCTAQPRWQIQSLAKLVIVSGRITG